MTKKDFTQVNTNRVYDAIAEATAEPETPAAEKIPMLDESEAQELFPKKKERKTYSEKERQEIMRTLKTAGYKGCKLPRINLAFAPDVYDYISTMSQVRGQTMTAFVDHVLRKSMQENAEIYAKAIEFKNSL